MRENFSSEMMEDEELEKKRLSPYLPGEGHSDDVPRAVAGPVPSPSPPALPPFSDHVIENVLENVLQFLTSPRDRNAASLVCRTWYRVESQTRRELFVGNCYAVAPSRAAERFRFLRALVLKGKPRFADFNLMPQGWGAHFKPWVAAMAAGCPGLERVFLKRMSVTDEDLDLLDHSFPNFHDLSLICCESFSIKGLAAVAENCGQLRVLDLIENEVGRDEDGNKDWVSSFPATTTTLESLVFESFVWPVSFEALEALVARSPALRRLQVNQHVSVGQLRRLMIRAPQLTHLGTGSFTTIPELGTGAGGLDVADLRSAFASSKSLVCLSGFQLLDEEFLPAVYPVCANLTSLNLSYADISAEHLKAVIRQCHNLRTFWVLDTVGDDGLQVVAATCKDLRELRVFPFDPTEDSEGSVSDIGLAAISEGCPKLQSILYFCQRMTNAAVVTMSRNCPELAVFRLCIMGRRCPDHATGEPMDEGFGSIVMKCKKLTRLAVSGLLTDRAFEYIGRYGKLVRTLSVAFAGDTDLSLRYVLEGCPKLQKLEIRDSPFGNAGLLSGIHHYYNMRFLWMSTCELTSSGCKEVAQRLPRLVVELMSWDEYDEAFDDDTDKTVGTLYMYRSLAGPRYDTPDVVKIL